MPLMVNVLPSVVTLQPAEIDVDIIPPFAAHCANADETERNKNKTAAMCRLVFRLVGLAIFALPICELRDLTNSESIVEMPTVPLRTIF